MNGSSTVLTASRAARSLPTFRSAATCPLTWAPHRDPSSGSGSWSDGIQATPIATAVAVAVVRGTGRTPQYGASRPLGRVPRLVAELLGGGPAGQQLQAVGGRAVRGRGVDVEDQARLRG